MTRSHGEELTPYDPEIERTFHRRKNNIERGENSGETDPEEQLVIVEPTMEAIGAAERPMMEYSFPPADGTTSSIVKPAVEANNFEIKPAIIQIIRSSAILWFNGVSSDAIRLRIFPFSLCDTAKDWLQSLPAGSITTWAALTQKFLAKYFPPAKTAKMLNEITSFVQLDRESLYEAWERFKSMLRKCPHHELPVWRQVQTFYNGVTLANRATIDAAAGGTIMKKLPSEAFNIIDEIATNLYSYGQERVERRTAGIHSIDAISALSAQITALTHRMDNLGAAIFEWCTGGTLWCMRSNFNPILQHVQSGWRSHPNFSWSNNQQQGPARPLPPRQPPPQEPKSNLEEMFSKFITATDTRFQNQDASIRNIEMQLGQLVSMVSGRREGQLPSDTEKNPKEQVNAVTLKNDAKLCQVSEGSDLQQEEMGEWRDDMEEDANTPLILGRPFLATGKALIDVQKGQLTLRINDEEVIFNVFKAIKHPRVADHEAFSIDCIEMLQRDCVNLSNDLDPITDCIVNSDRFESQGRTEESLQEEKLKRVLRENIKAIGWSIADIRGISPVTCTHKILMEEGHKPKAQPQRRLNPNMQEVVKKEILKWLAAGIIYPISDSMWVSPVQCVPKKGGMTVVTNEQNELIPTRTVTGWRVCIDYRALNDATRKDHFPLPFIDQMVEKLAGHAYYCFLDGYSGYHQVAIAPEDQEKTTFTCPYGTFLHLEECHLGCVMPPLLSNVA
ncbi:UNVERIFIED_CONTAM: hypothetical protein Sradi_3980300 [Sesamum radiatum]|uniref:Retrotransposon gag domain-containing protein n=1 Tax=Sesamum radiatum TaxID=300843 RepID=A0AAW2PHY7_SESRA